MNTLNYLETLKTLRQMHPEGFTYNLLDGQLVKKGWVIGMKETQNCFNSDGLNKALQVSLASTSIIGGWKDENLFYWDACYLVEEEAEAIRLGIVNEQKTICCLQPLKIILISKYLT